MKTYLNNSREKSKKTVLDFELKIQELTNFISTQTDLTVLFDEEFNDFDDFVKYVNSVKKILYDIQSHVIDIKMYFQLIRQNQPKIINDLLLDLLNIESGSLTVLDSISKYYSSRGKLSKKVIKHPRSIEYKLLIKELDQTQLFYLKTSAIETLQNCI